LYCNAGAADETDFDVSHIVSCKAKNLSSNKYKFVSGSTGSRRKTGSRRTSLPRKSQYVFHHCWV